MNFVHCKLAMQLNYSLINSGGEKEARTAKCYLTESDKHATLHI
jgi:hypothetical protein